MLKKFFRFVILPLSLLFLIVAVYFITIRKLDNGVLELDTYGALPTNDLKVYTVPSEFIDGARFYIKVPLFNGDTIKGFGDTGGGVSMILPSTIEKHHLNELLHRGLLKGIMPVKYLLFEELVKASDFPKPLPSRSFVIRNPFSRVDEANLVVPPMDEEMKFIMQSMPEMEAFFGQNFFMGKAWTIDYPHQTILLNTPIAPVKKADPNVQTIGFRKNANGKSIYGHASMSIVVNGQAIDVLFDTGATLTLSEKGKKSLRTEKKTLGGSFIAASVFEKWRRDHPEWMYISKGDQKNDIIQVPKVKIGTHEIGPVLFAKRADENWSQGMIGSMDKVVKGAIGGSAFQYLKVTVDYNSELIQFEKN